jgi:RimJ/RimL family protein N-acetyltransferase
MRLDRESAAIRRRERLRFRFNRNLASYLAEQEKPTGDIKLLRLDADLVAAAAPLGMQLESRFWSSAEDFLRNGVGLCAVAAGQVVGLCYSACIADGHAEVDVAVDVKFRRRGIASLVTREFVRECTHRGIKPTWDCFTTNEASVRLAVSLGFERTLAYPLYSFNVPVRLP